jgi:hypothetical protein
MPIQAGPSSRNAIPGATNGMATNGMAPAWLTGAISISCGFAIPEKPAYLWFMFKAFEFCIPTRGTKFLTARIGSTK